MFATATAHTQPLTGVLHSLRSFRPRLSFTRGQVRLGTSERDADQDRIFLRTLDELGLFSGEVGMTDRGLLEQAARLRTGWS